MNRISPVTADNSIRLDDEEVWTDDEVFKNDSFVRATQGMMDCATTTTPLGGGTRRRAWEPSNAPNAFSTPIVPTARKVARRFVLQSDAAGDLWSSTSTTLEAVPTPMDLLAGGGDCSMSEDLLHATLAQHDDIVERKVSAGAIQIEDPGVKLGNI